MECGRSASGVESRACGEEIGRLESQFLPKLTITMKADRSQTSSEFGNNAPGELHRAIRQTLRLEAGRLCRSIVRIQRAVFRKLAPQLGKSRIRHPGQRGIFEDGIR